MTESLKASRVVRSLHLKVMMHVLGLQPPQVRLLDRGALLREVGVAALY